MYQLNLPRIRLLKPLKSRSKFLYQIDQGLIDTLIARYEGNQPGSVPEGAGNSRQKRVEGQARLRAVAVTLG